MRELLDIEENKIHKPGQKLDFQLFERQYREKVNKWMQKKSEKPDVCPRSGKVERSVSQISKRSKVVTPIRPSTANSKKATYQKRERAFDNYINNITGR